MCEWLFNIQEAWLVKRKGGFLTFADTYLNLIGVLWDLPGSSIHRRSPLLMYFSKIYLLSPPPCEFTFTNKTGTLRKSETQGQRIVR